MLVPGHHPVHIPQREQKQLVVIPPSRNHLPVGRYPKAADLLLVGLVSEHLRISSIVLYGDVSVLAACDDQVVRAAYGADSAAVQVLHLHV